MAKLNLQKMLIKVKIQLTHQTSNLQLLLCSKHLHAWNPQKPHSSDSQKLDWNDLVLLPSGRGCLKLSLLNHPKFHFLGKLLISVITQNNS